MDGHTLGQQRLLDVHLTFQLQVVDPNGVNIFVKNSEIPQGVSHLQEEYELQFQR